MNRGRNHIRVQPNKNWSKHENCDVYSTDRQKIGTCIAFVGLGPEQKCTSWERSMMDGLLLFKFKTIYFANKFSTT